MIIKLGVPPFHFWILIISSYINWNNLFFILTIQKIIPIYILTILTIPKHFIIISLFICSIIPPIIIINLTNLKKLLTYSSINQLGWIILLIYLKTIIWLRYLISYLIISIIIFFIIIYYKIYNNFIINSSINNIIILLIILNIARIPPFIFFIFKWFRIYILIINSNLFFISLIIIIRSFLMFFIYINIIYLTIFTNLLKSKIINLPNYQTNYTNILILFIIIIPLPIFIT